MITRIFASTLMTTSLNRSTSTKRNMHAQSTTPVAIRQAKKETSSFTTAFMPEALLRNTHLRFVTYAKHTENTHASIVLAITPILSGCAMSQ